MLFRSVQSLQKALRATFGETFDGVEPIEVGYIEPGHGSRGKQRWLTSTEDLQDMYTMYERRSEILLWAFSAGTSGNSKRKRTKSPTDKSTPAATKAPRSNFQEHTLKIQKVEEIAKDLKERHGDKYTSEQYNVWAHMIHMGKHDSRLIPPDKPFFRTSGTQQEQTRSPASQAPVVNSLCVSPGKRIGLRTECMEQLDKWYALLEKGVITTEQYEEHQQKILKDMKQF